MGGAHRGWELAASQMLVGVAVIASIATSMRTGRLTWRRTALDLPFVLVLLAGVVQLLIGNRALVGWALGPPLASDGVAETWPRSLPWLVGTVAPAQTLASLVLFLAYAGVYYLVVHHVRERRDLGAVIRTIVTVGGLLAFGGLIDYLVGEAWAFPWRDARGSRLAGSFVNPDHFATWLAMVACLGLGYLVAGRPPWREPLTVGDLLRSREIREEAIKRYLPFPAIALTLLALVFTLSRGGLVSILTALVAFVAVLYGAGRMRRPLVIVAVLLGVALGYGAWVGLAPVLTQIEAAGAGLVDRLAQYRASLPMLGDFPLLGVGLGAYKDIYPRYQPLGPNPGGVYYPYAHSDLLQFAIEMGVVGVAIFVFGAYRLFGDLVASHCFGRGACPVGGGEGEGSRRRDPYGVSIAVGALAGLVALLVHSGVDFSLRIPANGFLAAALLGIATVALHTRFASREAMLLSATRDIAIPPRVRGGVVVLLVLAGVGLAWYVARDALLDRRLAAYRALPSHAGAEAVVAADPGSARALLMRGASRLQQGVAIGWRPDRKAESAALLDGAIADMRQAVAATPTAAMAHEGLAQALAARGQFDRRPDDVAAALAHFRRAIALAPEDPRFYRSLARFAVSHPPFFDLGLQASAGAVARDPRMLAGLVDQYSIVRMTDAQWLAAVPVSAGARLQLAALLEQRGLLPAATHVAEAALDVASERDEHTAAHWLLARLRLAQDDVPGAIREIDVALTRDPDNPELYLVRADALKARGDRGTADAYRAAMAAVPRVKAPDSSGALVAFRLTDARLRRFVNTEVAKVSPAKYQLALASYLLARGLWDEAIPEWTAIVTANPRDASAHFSLATALEAKGQRDPALEHYRKAVALDGRSVYRARLAQLLWDTNQYFQAIAEWQAIREREPGNVDVRLALARAWVKVGKPADGIREYHRILQIDPRHARARSELTAAIPLLPATR